MVCTARTEVKEVRMRPVTEPHDYQVKLKSASKFLAKGAKVIAVLCRDHVFR